MDKHFYRYTNISLFGFLVFSLYVLIQTHDTFVRDVFIGYCCVWAIISCTILAILQTENRSTNEEIKFRVKKELKKKFPEKYKGD